ncbi:nitroreductase [Flavisphingomonas formosensis]|uniref:nitroreductase n=1 Tax=Flavisphingomonas formosensis TaxID=861534 RepID=UPI0012FA4C2D|nr:nitroreductase [Sphingomonas formosensis]
MDVIDAIRRRHATRAFLADPVDGDLLRELLSEAARAPSGGNLQPWRIVVLGGEPLRRFKAEVARRSAEGVRETPEHPVYPERLWEPFRGRRKAAGSGRYAALGHADGDPAALAALTERNQCFFGAPVALFFHLDRRLGAAQWTDLGLFLQSFMLLAVERGLATCPQAFWAGWPETVRAQLKLDPALILVAGMALGYPDYADPLVAVPTERVPLDDFATFDGI